MKKSFSCENDFFVFMRVNDRFAVRTSSTLFRLASRQSTFPIIDI